LSQLLQQAFHGADWARRCLAVHALVRQQTEKHAGAAALEHSVQRQSPGATSFQRRDCRFGARAGHRVRKGRRSEMNNARQTLLPGGFGARDRFLQLLGDCRIREIENDLVARALQSRRFAAPDRAGKLLAHRQHAHAAG
jgi:hypothetical protein